MNTMPYPVPLEGLDLRSSLDIDPGTTPLAADIRTYYNKVQKSDGRNQFAAFTPGQRPRNILQVFAEDFTKSAGLLWTQTSLWIYYVSSGLMVQSPEVFHGAASQRFGITNSMNLVAYSQGVDNIRYWDGVTFGDLITSGQNHAARFLIGFDNHIISARPFYSGIDHTTEIRWSVNGDPHDWAGAGSGSLQIVETSLDPITGMFLLGDRAFITKRNEILELVATGTNSPIFDVVPRISGTGLKAGYTIATGDLFAFWYGNGKVYQWDGSTLNSVGDRLGIQAQIHEAIQGIDASLIPELQGMVYEPLYEYHVLIPDFPHGDVGSHVAIYDYKNNRWFDDRTPFVTSIGFGSPDIFTGFGTHPVYVIQADLNGNFIVRGSSVTSYLGQPYNVFVDTRDIVPGRSQKSGLTKGQYQESLEWTNELMVVRFLTNPSAVTTVEISIDGGTTFPFSSTVTSDATGKGTVWFQVAYTHSVRVRFQNNSTAAWELDHRIEIGWEEAGANNV